MGYTYGHAYNYHTQMHATRTMSLVVACATEIHHQTDSILGGSTFGLPILDRGSTFGLPILDLGSTFGPPILDRVHF